MDGVKDRGKGGEELSKRLLDFAVGIIRLVNALPKTAMGKYIGGQLMRSGTSAGSNYEEACGAESKVDFIHKLSIVLKELKESRFWLVLIQRTDLLRSKHLKFLIQECQELCAIVAKSILTSRKNR